MGFLSKLLNPISHTKDMARGLKATAKGDYNTMLDPGRFILPKQTPQGAQGQVSSAPKPRPTPYMGPRGQTIFLGGMNNPRQYVNNPFMGAPPPPPSQGAAPSSLSMSFGGGAPISSPKMNPNPAAVGQHQAIINALRGRMIK